MVENNELEKYPLGCVVIAVVMFFVALATDIFWMARLVGNGWPITLPVDPKFHDAFAWPDLVLSLLLYFGGWGILRLRPAGLVLGLVALGMWLFDSILVLAITGYDRISIVGPSLVFAGGAIGYLWKNQRYFQVGKG